MKMYGVIGAGGFGREVAPLVRRVLALEPAETRAGMCFVVESDAAHEPVNGVVVMGIHAFINLSGERRFNVAIGNSLVRERISERLIGDGCIPFSIVAENAVIMDGNRIGEGVILSPFTTITSNASIGKFFHANIYSYVAHDCVIGDYVTFAPGVKCNGNVNIGDHAYIGTGAVLKQGTSDKPLMIGRGATVGMGAIVTKDVPPNVTVIGNPARLMESKA
jgi:sugar O-acyltransferase (sialic acid O-acetyltransferase NeuD family)